MTTTIERQSARSQEYQLIHVRNKTALPVRQSVLTTSFICECRYYCCMQLVSMTRKWYPLICSLWALPFSAMPRCVRHRPQCNVPLRNFHSHTHTNMPALCCSRRYCATPKNCLSLCEWAILCALSRIYVHSPCPGITIPCRLTPLLVYGSKTYITWCYDVNHSANI